MAPREDDEMELINAEFDSLVAGLNLDQSSPRTYLDDLDDLAASESAQLYHLPPPTRGIRRSIMSAIETIKGWWRMPGGDENDGAVL